MAERAAESANLDQQKTISPLDFAADVLGVTLWDKQREVLSALPDHRRVAVKSGNGLGKGYCASVAALWFLYTHDPAVVLSTAPTFRQVRHVLWRQIRQLYFRSREPLGGKILDSRWELSEDRYALGLSADTADQFQGFHSANMFIVVDEAEGVSDEIYEAIDSVMTSAETSRLLLIGNPTTVTGAFRRAFYEERNLYHTITISALESPNVLAGKIVTPGLTTTGWVEERKEIWGEENPLFRARVLGEFPEQSDDTLFKLSDIEAAGSRHIHKSQQSPEGSIEEEVLKPALESPEVEPEIGPAVEPDVGVETTADTVTETAPGSTPESTVEAAGDADILVLGVDVARFGSDKSVILRRRGGKVEEIKTFQGLDTMQLAGWVAAAIQEYQPDQVLIDEVGVGAGVVDRLREQGFRVKGINVARSARQGRLFANLRAEGYWHLRELFESGQVALPANNQLMGELAAMRYSYDSQGRILMESKDDLRQRGLPSPDRADALMLAFLEPTAKARLWT